MKETLKSIYLGIQSGQLYYTDQVVLKFNEGIQKIRGRQGDWALTINDGVAHRKDYVKFTEGDLVKFDSWYKEDGIWYDAAINVNYKSELSDFARHTQDALKAGIQAAQVGAYVSDIGEAIQDSVAGRYYIIPQLSGHGIGEKIHMEPRVLNYKTSKSGPILTEGQRIAIEPLLIHGNGTFDSSTWKTTDGSLASHSEVTIKITKAGPVIEYGYIP